MNNNNLTTLKNQVYDALFADILDGVYPEGTMLTEKFLMERYDVSRAPIREALTQLTGTQLLASVPRQGYRILQPSQQQLQEIIKLRSALESSFLERYFTRIDSAQILQLRTMCENYTNCPDNDFLAHWHYNCQFHLTLFSMYGNDYAYKILEDALNIQTVFFVHKKHFASMDLHLALVDYLEKGDGATAVTLLKTDIENLLHPDTTAAMAQERPQAGRVTSHSPAHQPG
jgi:DNA-binding GntR family transcriptional regulator